MVANKSPFNMLQVGTRSKISHQVLFPALNRLQDHKSLRVSNNKVSVDKFLYSVIEMLLKSKTTLKCAFIFGVPTEKYLYFFLVNMHM